MLSRVPEKGAANPVGFYTPYFMFNSNPSAIHDSIQSLVFGLLHSVQVIIFHKMPLMFKEVTKRRKIGI